jgi:hypothetical protein
MMELRAVFMIALLRYVANSSPVTVITLDSSRQERRQILH